MSIFSVIAHFLCECHLMFTVEMIAMERAAQFIKAVKYMP